MRHLACVDLPALPLQLLVRRRKEWRDAAVAVVDSDRPNGRILWVNEAARRARILPGLRYAAALSLDGSLRAAEVPEEEITRGVDAIARHLARFSPSIEADDDEPGVFWLDASGLERLEASLEAWASSIERSLEEEAKLVAMVVVGFTKFATRALARSGPRTRSDAGRPVVLSSADDEKTSVRSVRLDRWLPDAKARDTLAKLGVHTIGDFVDLPPDGVRRRLGREAWQLHREARGELRTPLAPLEIALPLEKIVHLDHEEGDAERLVLLVRDLLRPLLDELGARDLALAQAHIALRLDRGGHHTETIAPAAPTLDERQIVELCRLRFASMPLERGVTDVALRVVGARPRRAQAELFAHSPTRDLRAAERALARLRAEFGDDAVVHARLREGHLPEATFTWERLTSIREAMPSDVATGALVRRHHHRPLLLPARPRHEPDGWMLRGLDEGPVVRVSGPHIIAGGWWRGPGSTRAIHREYHYAETQKGDILWVYYDRGRRRWLLEGRVE